MKQRPLSPHLQIYRWEWTMFYSISHRASGVFLSLGTLLLTAWLVSIAVSRECFEWMQFLLSSPVGLVLLFGWSWALFYHLINGCRHLIWDSGAMMELPIARFSGHFGFALAMILNLAVWFPLWDMLFNIGDFY